MYKPKHYKHPIDEQAVRTDIYKQGFVPQRIVNAANYIYSPHSHPETKLIVALRGQMKVLVEDQKLLLRPGDQLIIPGFAIHSALVGPSGCTFFWSEKKI